MAKPPRTKKRASSHAHTPCPVCQKRLHGERGLKAHLRNQHPDEVQNAGLQQVAEEVLAERNDV